MKYSLSFVEKLNQAWNTQNSLLCIGLDPDPKKFPFFLQNKNDAIFVFCRKIIDATADLICCYKLQIAYFGANRAENQLEKIIHYIQEQYPYLPIILDAKRSDISQTSEQYAKEAFERYNVDAITVNPYMGFDSIEPYLRYKNRGVIILCLTSNLGSLDLQFLSINHEKKIRLFEHIAYLASTDWNKYGQIALVVGATFPNEIALIRKIVKNMPLLIPGIGEQHGNIQAVVTSGEIIGKPGIGMILNSSRAILYGNQDNNFIDSVRRKAIQTRDLIRNAITKSKNRQHLTII